ncbi:Uncharacterised protein [Sphingomonas paucimobilis]|nr:Uncharacterised protein [Sphingomonas paucimobilis]
MAAMSPASNSDLSPHCQAGVGVVSAGFSVGGVGVSGCLSTTGAFDPPAAAGLRVTVRVLGTGAPAFSSEGEREKVLSDEDLSCSISLGARCSNSQASRRCARMVSVSEAPRSRSVSR